MNRHQFSRGAAAPPPDRPGLRLFLGNATFFDEASKLASQIEYEKSLRPRFAAELEARQRARLRDAAALNRAALNWMRTIKASQTQIQTTTTTNNDFPQILPRRITTRDC